MKHERMKHVADVWKSVSVWNGAERWHTSAITPVEMDETLRRLNMDQFSSAYDGFFLVVGSCLLVAR